MRKRQLFAGLLASLALIGHVPLHAGYTVDGAPICTAMGVQNQPQICSDDAEGAIVVWLEYRFYPPRIYAQRIDELGRAKWAVNGIEIGASDYSVNRPRIVADGSGGAIFVWEDYYNFEVYDLYAQRVDSLGNLLWGGSGVAVCTAANDQYWSVICSDGSGGCIIAWTDKRTSSNSDIYAQRVNAAGSPVWTADGIAVCTADSIQEEVQIVADGSGGAVLVWCDDRDGGDLYAQKVNASGVAQWTANGAPVCQYNDIQYEPKIDTDGAGGVFVVWYDRRGVTFDIYLQRIASNGSEVFTSGGITICNESQTQRYPQITADGAGGAIVVWEDFRDGSPQSYLYAQRVNSSGTKVWLPASGVPIRYMSGHPYYAVLVSDQNEGAIISWADDRNVVTSGWDVYAQRINDIGTCLWDENGIPLCTATGSQNNLTPTTDCAGGMIVAWRDTRVPDDDIYGQRITIDGEITATLLRSFAASHDEKGIMITWTLEEAGTGLQFLITRMNVATARLEEITHPVIERSDMTFTFIDDSFDPGGTYSYRIDAADEDGRRTLFETGPIKTPAAALRLLQNYPNPLNPSTTIRYYLPERCHVTMEIFDAAGREIACLVDRTEDRGSHHIIWNGSDSGNNLVGSGVYLYRLTAGKKTISKKMILLR